METISALLSAARQRARELQLPYDGALLPHEAWALLQAVPQAKLIDVRSRAEIELTGAPPGTVHVEWQSWPGWVANPHFLAQLGQAVDPESLMLFLCRSGRRSHLAAALATESGRTACYNVLEGFEGDLDRASGHRGEHDGWKRRGLPWAQT